MSDTYPIGGWLWDQEDPVFLASVADESAVLAMRGSYNEALFDPRKVIRVEQQAQQGACQGHAISTCCEWTYIVQTGDTDLQLSRAMGYYETQRIDGIRGDSGSTISGGVKLASTTGICEESLWPYPSRYSNSRPRDWDAVKANAAKYRIGNSLRLTTYDGIRTFLGSGQGGITIGISWGNEMSRAVVESFSGAGGGGHAISLLSLSDRKSNDGRPYVWMCNSWGTTFGNGGWSEWSPRAIDQMCNHRHTTAIGVSDMPAVKPRPLSLDALKMKLRV